jgi:hypothetical protein
MLSIEAISSNHQLLLCSRGGKILILKNARVPNSNLRFRLVMPFMPKPSYVEKRNGFCETEDTKDSLSLSLQTVV